MLGCVEALIFYLELSLFASRVIADVITADEGT